MLTIVVAVQRRPDLQCRVQQRQQEQTIEHLFFWHNNTAANAAALLLCRLLLLFAILSLADMRVRFRPYFGTIEARGIDYAAAPRDANAFSRRRRRH